MACGGKTCKSLPTGPADGFEMPPEMLWLASIFARPVQLSDRTRNRSPLTEIKVRRHWILARIDTFMLMLEKHRQRQRLLDLDDHLLRDIGLTRAQAEEMARRPFWR